MTSRVPFVVVGAGAAGMMAAVAAAEAGVDVLLLEKDVRRGCNAELSGGLVQGAGTRHQAELGVHDSPAELAADVLRQNGGQCDEAIVRLVAGRSADVVHTLADVVGLDLHLDTRVRYAGHSKFRMHATPSETGRELTAGIRSFVRSSPRIDLVDRAEVVDVQEAAGGLEVVVRRGNDDVDTIRADNALLAADGFGANRELLRRYIGEDVAAQPYVGSENCGGAGLEIGVRLGADTAFMTAYEGHSHLNPKYGTRLGGALPALGSIVVGRDGRRFAREDVTNSGFSVALLDHAQGQAVEIFDERIHELALANGAYQEAVDAGAVSRHEDLEDLAVAFGLPVASLVDEVRRYNEATAGVDWLGRSDERVPLAAPYHASHVSSGLVHTQGGLVIDAECRVLTASGEVVPRLFAAGGTAAGISGSGPDTYLPGNGLAHAFATGLVAGEVVATQVA